MKTFIVLIPLEENGDARKQCELIENMRFEPTDFPCDTVNAQKVRDKVITLIDDDTYDLSNIEVEPITDFMDRVNNEEFNTDNYFMSYVFTTKMN
jgi:hypothetical protein